MDYFLLPAKAQTMTKSLAILERHKDIAKPIVYIQSVHAFTLDSCALCASVCESQLDVYSEGCSEFYCSLSSNRTECQVIAASGGSLQCQNKRIVTPIAMQDTPTQGLSLSPTLANFQNKPLKPSLCEIMLGAFPLTYAQVHIKSSRVVKNDLKSKRADMALLLLLLGHISPILVEDLAMIETHPQY